MVSLAFWDLKDHQKKGVHVRVFFGSHEVLEITQFSMVEGLTSEDTTGQHEQGEPVTKLGANRSPVWDIAMLPQQPFCLGALFHR